MKKNPGKEKKRILVRNVLFSIITIIIFLFLLEGGVRLFYLVSGKIKPKARHLSEKYGWVSVPNIKSKKRFKGYGKISYSTKQYGFRLFGDIKTNKTRILVIGDSQTNARKVSDGEAYYHYIKKNTDTEVFAYGVGGYGSLQEYMILDKYYNLIKPDIIIWQFSNNDFINNSWKLECICRNNNSHMTRPYYIDGKIEWKYPHRSWIYRNILRHSYLIKLFNIKLNIILAGKLVERDVDLLSLDNPLFDRALKTTLEIMKLVRKRVGDTPVIAFLAAFIPKPTNTNMIFSNTCKECGIYYIYSIPGAIDKALKSGLKVNGMPYDPHWNNVGHSIVGKILVEFLISKEFFRKKS